NDVSHYPIEIGGVTSHTAPLCALSDLGDGRTSRICLSNHTFHTPTMIFPKPTSHYEKGFKRSPALERATAPFRVRNALTGAGIVVFCVSVCMSLFPCPPSCVSAFHATSRSVSMDITHGSQIYIP